MIRSISSVIFWSNTAFIAWYRAHEKQIIFALIFYEKHALFAITDGTGTWNLCHIVCCISYTAGFPSYHQIKWIQVYGSHHVFKTYLQTLQSFYWLILATMFQSFSYFKLILFILIRIRVVIISKLNYSKELILII